MDIFSIILVVSSFLFSLYTAYRQRKYLTVCFDSNYFLIDTKTQIEDARSLFQNEKSTKAIFLQITIVNPSFVNMAYFDLRAFNPITNENHCIATAKTIPELRAERHLLLTPFLDNPSEKIFIEIPEQKHGAIPAGACITLDVLVFLNENVDLSPGVAVCFKSTEKTWLHRSRWSETERKQYKPYFKIYSVKSM